MAESALPDTLFAGGGDFFDVLLSTRIGTPSRSNRAWPIGSFVLVCGSLADRDNRTFDRAIDLGLQVIYTPGRIASGDSHSGPASDTVRSDIAQNLKLRRGVVVATPDHTISDHDDRMAISSRLIDLAVGVPKDIGIDEYLVTGGFTADLLMQKLGFRTCRVSGQWADGVVRLTASGGSGPAVTIKPGSYAWPDTIWNAIAETDQGIPA
ncbi:MAG: nucleotide-binding domain containing protein [Phycisphaerales bacterium]